MQLPYSYREILTAVITVAVIMVSIIVHEVSHGWAAYKLGDPTARAAGRLSFNPLKHVDPIGTIFLPLSLFITGLPVFGYAKPVPYNPLYFKNRKRDEVLTALAGPASNLVLAIIFTAIMAGIHFFFSSSVLDDALYTKISRYEYPLLLMSFEAMQINLVLMFFNLLPIPPLDGSKCISYFLNPQQMHIYYRLQQYSMLILFVFIFIVPRIFAFDPLGAYLHTMLQISTGLLMFWM